MDLQNFRQKSVFLYKQMISLIKIIEKPIQNNMLGDVNRDDKIIMYL